MSHSDKNTSRVFQEGVITRFKDRLREAMKGESNNSLAKRCNMSDKVIRDYLNGLTTPSLERLEVIAKALDCSVAWLAAGEQEQLTHNQSTTQQPTQQQRERWLSLLERMTPDEIDSAINNINRNGINMLLAPPQQQLAQPVQQTESTSDISMRARKMAELYDMADENGKKYIQQLFDDVQRANALDSKDKKKAG